MAQWWGGKAAERWPRWGVRIDGVRVRRRGEWAGFVHGRAPVGGGVVPLAAEHLRREVLGAAAQRGRALVGRSLGGEAEVEQLEVALAVEQQVLGAHVAVHLGGARGATVGGRGQAERGCSGAGGGRGGRRGGERTTPASCTASRALSTQAA